MRLGEAREILGVDPSATPDEVKKIYRRLCIREHPDKSDAADATERFQNIQDAWTCCQAAEEAGAWSDDDFGDSDDDDDGMYADEDMAMELFAQMFGAAMFGGGRAGPMFGGAGGFPFGGFPFPGGFPGDGPGGGGPGGGRRRPGGGPMPSTRGAPMPGATWANGHWKECDCENCRAERADERRRERMREEHARRQESRRQSEAEAERRRSKSQQHGGDERRQGRRRGVVVVVVAANGRRILGAAGAALRDVPHRGQRRVFRGQVRCAILAQFCAILRSSGAIYSDLPPLQVRARGADLLGSAESDAEEGARDAVVRGGAVEPLGRLHETRAVRRRAIRRNSAQFCAILRNSSDVPAPRQVRRRAERRRGRRQDFAQLAEGARPAGRRARRPGRPRRRGGGV